MRFYKLNGVWQSWDYLHNELGYAEHATRPTVFKSCADATWGEDAGNGYYDGDVSDMINGTFWTDADPTGWFDLDGLVWNSETYPADATPSLLVKDGVASDALVITCEDGNYYLIRAIIDTTAWIPESEVEALGWRSPSFVVVDSTTGKVVSGCNQELTTHELPSVVLNIEDGYETYELPSVSLPTPNVVIGVPITGPVQAFWFTDEGRDETSDKTFTVVGNPLFDEDGSVARNALYDSAVPLSFMQCDGNMFEADSDIVRYLPVTDRLVLSIPGDSTTRGKSAWSVQVAKLFVLSYANTQLPDVQIELPINEVGTYGASITLPTIDGEYESGGKTWKPSAWDIGAFGSSYSLTADTVAHLVFEEVQQYQEITLYMQSGTKLPQTSVTSSFVGNVISTYCYQLYTDEECTIPWTGYDYSNDYVLGYYRAADGEWVERIDSVVEMPDSTTGTTSEATFGYVLLDTGNLWLISNYTYSGTYGVGTSKVVVRIYPKAQQHYALYFNYNNLYGNYSLGASRPGYPWPSGTSGNYMAWFASYPVPSVVKFLGSAGNEFLQGGDVGALAIRNDSSNALEVARIGYTNNINIRCAIFTLDSPTLFAWTMADKTNRSISSGTVCTLYDENGNVIAYDDLYSYKILGVLQATGENCSRERNVIQYASLLSSNSALAFRQTYGSVTASKIWYVKEQRNIIVNFGDPVTIPDGFAVDSVKCTKLFIKPGEISYSGHVIYFEYPGANVYSDDTDLALFGVGVNPCIEMFGFSNASTFAGFRLSVDFSRTGYATAVSALKLNTDGYFVKGKATLSSRYTTSTYVGYMQTNPMMFRLYINSAVKSYHFNVPQSVWQYQNGAFSWLGNDTDTTDLAYWYKSAPDIQINLRPI